MKPCPFCGEYPSVDEYATIGGHVELVRIVCSHAAHTAEVIGSPDFASKEWNARAEPRTCSTCYYYQTVYERNRPTDRRACFGEHLRVSVGGLDWDEEAEAWADMAPGDCCSRWTAKKICRTIGANGEQVDACSQD